MSFLLYELAKDSETTDRLYSIAQEGEASWTRHPFVIAVVKEALRLHSAIPYTERVCLSDDLIPLSKPYTIDERSVSAIAIKRGDILGISWDLINTSSQLWGEDSTSFRPQRWLTGNRAHVSFGIGRDACIGSR